MKKPDFYFIGECAIIFALLVLIGVLVKDDQRAAARERTGAAAVVDLEEGKETLQEEEQPEEVMETQEVSEENQRFEKNVTVVKSERTDSISANMEETGAYSGEMTADNTAVGNAVVNSTAVDNTAPENAEMAEAENKTKIVVFGDSIWNGERGEDGISERVMEALDVIIYNCAIGGTTAAVDGESPSWDNWDDNSFNGMMYVANGVADADKLLEGTEAYDVITKVDFNEVDYIIVSYGLNDYFCDIPIYPQEYFDTSSFVGALRHGIHRLRREYPHLKFIVTSPTYCEWFKGERQFELGAYVEAARSVAQEMEVEFLDMYHALGKTPDEKMEYLSDGVHLNEEGRRLYAHSVIEYLKTLEKEEM